MYRTVVIDTNKFKDLTVNWSLRVESRYIAIGINASDEITDSFCFARCSNSCYYAWYGHNGDLCTYTGRYRRHSFDEGDTIKMELNVKHKILKLYRNDQDINVKFDNIDTTKTYRLALSMYTMGGKRAQLIDSQFIP